MPRFFISAPVDGFALLTGEDAAHITRSLRMTAGDAITLCDGQGTDYFGVLCETADGMVKVKIDRSEPSRGEPDCRVTLFQGLPKGEKMDLIVQKSVELGAAKIVPFLAARCVSRPDAKAAAKKVQRWQKIAEEAAKQSQRGKIPAVLPLHTLEQALSLAAQDELTLAFYEAAGEPLRMLIAAYPAPPHRVSFFIGPEGGFDPGEIAAIEAAGGRCATLGPRILRTETAPLCALSAWMAVTGNLD